MSYLKAKMHQIPLRLGLRPGPLAGFKGPTSKGEDGRGRGNGGEGKSLRAREGRGKGGE